VYSGPDRVAFIKQAKPYGLFDKSRFSLLQRNRHVIDRHGEDMVRMWGSGLMCSKWIRMNKRLVADFMKENGNHPIPTAHILTAP
jgi:hypothetical protein